MTHAHEGIWCRSDQGGRPGDKGQPMEGLREIRGGSEHLWRRGWHEAGSLLRRDGWEGEGLSFTPHLARVNPLDRQPARVRGGSRDATLVLTDIVHYVGCTYKSYSVQRMYCRGHRVCDRMRLEKVAGLVSRHPQIS